jgi:glutaminase
MNVRHRSIPAVFALVLAATLLVPASPASARENDPWNAQNIARLVKEAHAKFKDLKDGANADYIPELAKVPSELFGVAVVTVKGEVFTAGDVNHVFSIQSVSKPFTAALVMEEQSPQVIVDKIGVEPTGLPFNSIIATQLLPQMSANPLVNAGAIAAVSLVMASSPQERFAKIMGWYEKLAADKLTVVEDVYQSEAATNQNNRGIAYILANKGRMYAEPLEAVDVYTRQCSIGVTAKQLAVMGATLANRGVNPVSGRRVMKGDNVPRLLAVMMMAGFYNEAGAWAWSAGLPGKTGVGGGIVAVVPGRAAIVGFSPRLNAAGNSVRAMKAIEYIAGQLGANVFEDQR